jgi:hypothetical protein
MKTCSSIRIDCRSHADAKELALRLEADGYRAVARWKTVIARTQTREAAERLARALGVDSRSGDAPVREALAVRVNFA